MRSSFDSTYMDIVKVMAKRSTCARIQTASVIVRDNRIISTGYNGVCSGMEHCVDYWKKYCSSQEIDESYENWIKTEEFKHLHRKFSVNELHAERNAILFAAKEGISTNNSTIYTLYSPCLDCATSIYSAGIKRVVYEIKYDRSPSEGLDFLIDRGVEVVNISQP
jgi:dCMP deaminase